MDLKTLAGTIRRLAEIPARLDTLEMRQNMSDEAYGALEERVVALALAKARPAKAPAKPAEPKPAEKP